MFMTANSTQDAYYGWNSALQLKKIHCHILSVLSVTSECIRACLQNGTTCYHTLLIHFFHSFLICTISIYQYEVDKQEQSFLFKEEAHDRSHMSSQVR